MDKTGTYEKKLRKRMRRKKLKGVNWSRSGTCIIDGDVPWES